MKKSLGLLLVLLLAGFAWAQEFSATSITKYKGRPQQTAKLYFSKFKWRIETRAAGKSVATIFRGDKGVVWTLLPEQKIYTEVPLRPNDVINQGQKMPGEYQRKLLGKETINGMLCDKYLISYKTNGKAQSVYAWIADDMAVKTMAVDGSWSNELKDIVKGRQKSPLFDPPAGYRKLDVPGYKLGPFDKPAFKEQVMPSIPGMGN